MKKSTFTIAPMKMAQLAYSEMSDELITLLHRERKYTHVNIDKKDDFYFGNVFDEILEKRDKGIGEYGYYVSPEAMAELKELSKRCKNFIYVQILGE